MSLNHNNKDPNPLAPHLGGDSREEPQTGTDGQQSVEGVRKFVMVGVYHTPKQFLSRAKELNTPLMLQTTLNLSRDSREEPQTGTDGQQSVEGVRKFVMVGVYHTPKQFLSRAKELNTPLMLQTTLNLSRVRLCRLI